MGCTWVVSLSEKPSLKGRYNPLKVEEWVLEYWSKNNIYRKVKEKSWEKNRNAPLFRFLEGPPTANGFMHVGHARGRTLKDIQLRYRRMKGYRVWDQAGWDTQGLPVELEVEKKLGFKSKKDIENYGVEKFVKQCQELVDYYIGHWRKASERLGLWLDYDHAYQTRHPKYLDTTWSFLKTMWEKGLLYEDLRVVPVCPRCETALSSHEVAQGYKKIKDPSLYFKVPLRDEEKTYMVAWTTTPWTIIANEALTVHPEETYVKIRVGDEYWIMAEKLYEKVLDEVGVKEYEVVEKFKGKTLLGKKYVHPLLEEVPAHREHNGEYEHAIVVAEWVSMEEGTGVVHTAPAHGAEDFETGKKYGIRIFRPIKKNGYFTEEAGKYKGLWFKEANPHVIEDLRRKGLLVHLGEIEHDYPHCWRCDTPLMYYADRQWFINIDPIKKKMLEENDKVRWSPEWASKRFRDWIENARDWCISRERYWGTPLPVWTCKKCGYRVAFGSLEEVKKHALNPEEVVDHHRPWIDRVKIKCPRCGGIMEREPFVVDVWLDSGVAHTASLNQYGWNNLFTQLFPYDWITEAVDQTRGWFYTLMFTSVAWYLRSPYKAVLNQGLVLDKYGKKMSKSRGNVVWALEFMEKYGADPFRIYLASKAAPWDNINFDPDEVMDIKRQLDILWNSTNFALTYMELDKWTPNRLEEDLRILEPEDKWIIYELYRTLKTIEEAIEGDQPHKGGRAILEFIVEKLSHRYITLIRPRVWIEEDKPEKRSAYATLYLVLNAAIKAIAPYTPYIAEYLYQAFTRKLDPNAKESVHLEEWPTVPSKLLDKETWSHVDKLLEAAEQVLTLRAKVGIKRRWPLKRAVIVVDAPELIEPYKKASKVLAVYANVKEIEVTTSASSVEGLEELEVPDIKVYVDVKLDEEILLEGLAREIVRRIQVMRRDLNLPLDAVVEKVIVATRDELLKKAVEKHRDYILGEVRSKTIEVVEEPPDKARRWKIEGREAWIKVVV